MQNSTQKRELYLGMTRDMLPTLRANMADQGVVDRFEESLPTLAERCGRGRDPSGHQFVLIAHGDLWSNNVLFRMGDEEDGVPEALKIIDFQECMLSRPTSDLCCLLLTRLVFLYKVFFVKM